MSFTVPDLSPSPDLDEVRRALAVLIAPGHRFEIRALPTGKSWVGQDKDAAIEAIPRLAGGSGLYYTINPVRGDLVGAAKNRDIIERYWLMVDVDSVRPDPDLPATDEEKRQASELAKLVRLDLKSHGCPDPVVIDSGNGYQLLYRVSLPNDDLAHTWVRQVLSHLAKCYDGPTAKVDISVHNAARIGRLPGTWNRKGTPSPDRPHRMARLEVVPDRLDPIPTAAFEEIIGLHPVENDPPRLADWTVPRASDSAAAAWFRKALENELAKALLAQPSTRHVKLRAAVRTLAGYIHHGYLTEADIRAGLIVAGRGAGLPENEVLDVLDWAIKDGMENPLPWPEKLTPPSPVSLPTHDENGKPVPAIIWASQIRPRKVEWLWPRRIPIGKMTTFAGQGGIGKTFVLCDIAARISSGQEWPFAGGECPEPGQVLFISGEDDPDDTLVPRLMECGADLTRVAFLGPEAHDRFTLVNLDMLTSFVEPMTELRLVVIDPPTTYLGEVDSHKDAELRGAVLGPLKRWAAKHHVAVVLNTHVNKATGANVDAASRVMGSVAWVNAVRTAHMFIRDKDDPDEVLFVPFKVNITKRQKTLVYKVVETRDELAKVEWVREADTTADEALNKDAKKAPAKSARTVLIEMFRQQLEWPSDAFWKHINENGIPRRTLEETKARLEIPRARRTVGHNGDVVYTWWVPRDWPYLAED